MTRMLLFANGSTTNQWLWHDLMSKKPTPLRQFYDERKVKRQRSMFLVRTSSSLTMPIWEVLTFLIKKTAAYRLDRKSAGGRYYFRVFFWFDGYGMPERMHVVSILRDPKGVELLDFKQVVTKGLIGIYNTRSRNPPSINQSKRSFQPTPVPIHLPVVGSTRGKCEYCKNEGTENKSYIKCGTCGLFLCIVTGENKRNCFANHHYGYQS